MALSNLESLPSLVHDIILQQVLDSSLASVRNFHQVSKKCNQLAEPFIYRTIILTEQTNRWGRDPAWERTREFCRQILDPQKSMRNHVREIVIDRWREDDHEDKSEGFETDVLEQILQTVTNLESFSWNACITIPHSVLSAINNSWPAARLKVDNLNRAYSLNDSDMPDLDLLLSPQLHTLKFAVFYKANIGVSEFPILRHIISQSENLRVLHLEVSNSWRYHWSHLSRILSDRGLGCGLEGAWNLQLSKSSRVPPLEELKLSTNYTLPRDHCLAWRECMDWSKLKTLDLGDRCPQTFFTVLRGLLPSLISLKFTYQLDLIPRDEAHEVRGATHRCYTASEVGKFLDGIRGLEELYMTNSGERFFEHLWPYLIRHLPTIRVLEIYTTPHCFESYNAWGVSELLKLLSCSPRLERLSIDLNLEAKDRCRLPAKTDVVVDWPRNTFQTLARFSCLSFLTLRFNLSQEQFSQSQPIGDKHVLEAAVELSQAFFKNDTYSLLEKLVIIVGRIKCTISNPRDLSCTGVNEWKAKYKISKDEKAFTFVLEESVRFGGPTYDDMYLSAGY